LLDPFSIVLLGAEGVLIGPMLAGSVLYSQQKYDRAARAFEFAARVQPLPGLRATCYINLSACHAEMAQPELTLDACNQAERTSRSRYVHALAHINRAHAYLLLGKMDESQKEAEKAIELSPHWRRGVRYAMVNYADAMGRMGRYPEALQTAREALQRGGAPDPAAAAAARREIGMLLVMMGRAKEALQEMEQALQAGMQRPDHRGMIYQIMASAWVALGQPDEASRALDEAERLGVPPVNRPVLAQARARVCMLQGQVDHAIALLRAAEDSCKTPLVRLVIAAYLAACLCEKREFAEAMTRAREVLDSGCQYRHIRAICFLVQAQALFWQGEIHEACVALENARDYEGMSPILDAAIAVAHAHGSFESERYTDASDWARVAKRYLGSVDGNPELRRQAAIWLSRSLIREGRALEAQEEIQAALEGPGLNHRDEAGLLHAMGEAQLAVGDPQAAAERFRAAVHADSDNPLAWMSLGQLLARQGQINEGEACLRAARAADPEGVISRDADLALSELEAGRAAV